MSRIHLAVTRCCGQVEEVMVLPCWCCSLCRWVYGASVGLTEAFWRFPCYKTRIVGALRVGARGGGSRGSGGTSLLAEPKRCSACFRPSPPQPEVGDEFRRCARLAEMEAVTEGSWSALPVALSPAVLRALQELGFDRMTPVQVRGRLCGGEAEEGESGRGWRCAGFF